MNNEQKNELKSQFPNVPDKALEQLAEDLLQLGLSGADLNSVDVVFNATEVVRILRNRFRFGNNVLIYGTRGFGKTQMITQAAEQAGMNSVIEATSARLPEDYGGQPMAFEEEIPEEVYRAMVKADIKKKKIQDAIAAELQGVQGVINPKVLRQNLELRLNEEIDVTDDELQQVIDAGKNLPSRRRLQQKFAAPDWVINAMDAYATEGKRTLIFFDEINQATPDVMNSLFGLVQNKKFAEKQEFDLSDCVVFAAAGNFPRENRSLRPLPSPLIDRFQKILLFYAQWEDSIEWLKDSYSQLSQTNPNLVTLLNDSSITDQVWKDSFASPRSMEQFIVTLKKIEDRARAGAKDTYSQEDIGSFISSGNRSRLRDAIISFFTRLGIYEGQGASSSTSAPSALQDQVAADRKFAFFWNKYKKDIAASGSHILDGSRYDNSPQGVKAVYLKILSKLRNVVPTRELLENLGAYQELVDAGVPEVHLPK